MSQLIRIDAVEVRQDHDGRYCLNDLHRAAGGESRHQPSFFLRRDETGELIQEIARNSANQQSFPVASRLGRNGGTYVCRELVYAYAMWVSPAFHLKVIRTFDALATAQRQDCQPPSSEAALLRQLASTAQRAAELLEENERLRHQLTAPVPASPRDAPRYQRREMPWLSTIRAWLEQHPGMAEVTSTQLLVACLGLREPTNVQRGAVGRCMSALGWARGRRRHPGGLHWVYTRPASS